MLEEAGWWRWTGDGAKDSGIDGRFLIIRQHARFNFMVEGIFCSSSLEMYIIHIMYMITY